MYMLNLISSKFVPKIPIELWIGQKPRIKYFHIWGCPAYMLKGKSDKLEAKVEVCLFVGFLKGTRGGIFYSPNDNEVFVSTKTKFLKHDYVHNYKSKSRLF
jgi:hypothetical protein